MKGFFCAPYLLHGFGSIWVLFSVYWDSYYKYKMVVTLILIGEIRKATFHYDDVIMSMMASQITSLTIVYSTVYSGADQSKHQSSASLAFVWGIHRGLVRGKCFHLMTSSCLILKRSLLLRFGKVICSKFNCWYLFRKSIAYNVCVLYVVLLYSLPVLHDYHFSRNTCHVVNLTQ